MGVIKDKGCISVKEAISGFIFHCRFEKNLNNKSIDAYLIDLNQFLAFIEGLKIDRDIVEVRRTHLKDYLQELSDFKPKTIKRKIASLKAMFNHIEYENEDFINPFRKIRIRLKDAFTLPTVMTVSEVQKIFSLLYNEKDRSLNRKSYSYKSLIRNIAVLELLFATGIRVSELCELKKENINLSSGSVKVFGKGGRERLIQICDNETKAILNEYNELYANHIQVTDSFFINRLGNQLSSQSVRLMLHKYVKQAGLPKTITPHTFRHTFATLLLEEDVDIRYIQNMLGHSSINTTQIYTHVNSQAQKKILETKHPRGKFNFNPA